MQRNMSTKINKNEEYILSKSIENTNSALSIISSLMSKNDILNNELIYLKIEINEIEKKIEKISKEISINYPEDIALKLMLEKVLLKEEFKEARNTIKDFRTAIHLMKIIAANITSFDGDPSIWYKYVEIVKKLDYSKKI